MLSAADRGRILDAPLRMIWTLRDSEPDRVAGHAYLELRGKDARLLHLVHAPETTPSMVALLNEWRAAHPESSDRREQTGWAPPDSGWWLTVDAGTLAHELTGKTLSHEQLAGPDARAALDAFPEAFVREPVHTLLRHLASDIAWPDYLGPHVLRPRFHHARRQDYSVVTGCRYGSRHEDAGQDRTAAVFVKRDAAPKWFELPWNLPILQRLSSSGQFSWPPEQIDSVELVVSEGQLAPRILFEDPWILYEPGTEWSATWMPLKNHWLMEARGDGSF